MRTKSGNGDPVDLEQFVKDIKTVVHDGEALLKAGITQVKKRAISGAKSTDRAVRTHPYHTLGIVFGLGRGSLQLVSGRAIEIRRRNIDDGGLDDADQA